MSSINALMISPDRDGDDALLYSRDNNVGTRLHTVRGAAQDIKDLASDPANRDDLIRSYRLLAEARDDLNAAIEMIWRPR